MLSQEEHILIAHLRNSYDRTIVEMREDRLAAADKIEELKKRIDAFSKKRSEGIKSAAHLFDIIPKTPVGNPNKVCKLKQAVLEHTALIMGIKAEKIEE